MVSIADFVFKGAKASSAPDIMRFKPLQLFINNFVAVDRRHRKAVGHLNTVYDFCYLLERLTCVTCIDTISSSGLRRPTPRQSMITLINFNSKNQFPVNGQDQKGMNGDNTQNLSRQESRDLSCASDRFLAACQDFVF